MNLFGNLGRYLWGGNNAKSKQVKVPNGWGRQNYEGEIVHASHNEHVNINNIKHKRGWIQAYAAEKLEGIQNYHSGDKHYPYYTLTYKKKKK